LRLNTLLWPSGASRWSAFHALVDDAAMNAIRGATGSFGQALTIDDGVGPALSVTMYPLPPRSLSQIPGSNGLQLLTLLDRRAYWQWLSANIDVVGGEASWASLFGMIASALGIALDVDDVPAAYLSPPSALSGAYDSLPALLDAACLSCGLRFAAALDGTSYRCWSVAAAQAQVARNLSVPNPRVAGGLFLQGTDLNGVLPAAVQVIFPRADDGIPSPVPSVGLVTLASLNLPSNPPGGPALGGIGGLTKTFHSSAVATFASGSATNAVALAALATQAATDFYTWQATGVYDLAFAGVAPWLPTGADGLCEYAHAPDGRAGGGILSRFRRDAYFDQQEALWHHTATPCAAIPTRVRVTGTTLTDTCYYPAELVVRSGCVDVAVSPPVAVWLRPDGGAPAAGDVFLSSPEGVRAADGLPVYVAAVPAAPPAGGGGPGGTLTADTTTTLNGGVAWHVTGIDVSSVVDVTSLTWLFEATSVLVFAGPSWHVTANTTLTVSASVALAFVGLNATTSVIDITSLTWQFQSTSVLVLAGCAVNLTDNVTWTITALKVWLVTGGTVQYANTVIDIHTGVAVNITDNVTWTITALKVWNITGGSLSWTNIALVFGTGTAVDFTADQTWTLSGGVALTVTGGTLNLNSAVVFGGPSLTFALTTNVIDLCGDLLFELCPTPLVPAPVVQVNVPLQPNAGIQIKGPTPAPVVIDPGATWPIQGAVEFTGTVTGAGGLISSSATHYTGTTGDPYATMVDLVDGQGIHGSFVVKNTGASNSLELRITVTDMFGAAAVASSGSVSPGNHVSFVVDVILSGAPPIKELLIELKSSSLGAPTTYESYVSVTAAAALSVGNGGTGADLSATGGPGTIASQPVAGGPLAVVGPDMAELQLVGAVYGR
jgi:hypothetical protein